MSVTTRTKLVETLFHELGLNKREAKELIEEFFEVISTALETGEDIRVSGFGNFMLRQKKARPGRNPRTGEEVSVSARRVVIFRPGRKLRERVKAYVLLDSKEYR